MQRRIFSRGFKLEAMKLVTERGVAALQAARDLDVAESGLRRRDARGGSRHTSRLPGPRQNCTNLPLHRLLSSPLPLSP